MTINLHLNAKGDYRKPQFELIIYGEYGAEKISTKIQAHHFEAALGQSASAYHRVCFSPLITS
jgi:hypothetical protein